ncbi:MAG: hypothetical protein AB7E51_05290 [Pseudodesulfovibrio sp.]|uniref:DUF5675 domain-containing protein n=1 Tax=Pseudodesulfovibrio indicus TaxID=1716143 RepID=A0A126QSG7_9BACT|nr:hypothetical protein [Pseudodesulfovibrio indicus]AMK12395.1 hypothetical protein AWY79_15455 [Pseudodesulfovibrio indicus]TDT90693.1 hypothetical protein EDC59_102123 [Pseudodesulfovibrio indicus]
MFRQREWSFTGTSGKQYRFGIHPKSEKLPSAPGVYILAYTHPRGHLAGWQANPLHVGHADDLTLALEDEVPLDHDRTPLWNSTFVLLESAPSARRACVRDLEGAAPALA